MQTIIQFERKRRVEQSPLVDTSRATLARAREVINLWGSVLDSPNGLLVLGGENTVEKHEQHNALPWITLSAARAVTLGSTPVIYGKVGFIDKKDTLEMHANFNREGLLQSNFEDFGLDIILDYFRSHAEA